MYIDEGTAAPLDAMGKSVDAFARSAATGQFAINQSGGDALLAAIAKMMAWIDSSRADLLILDQQPMLGTSNAAETMKPYIHGVAADQQGLLTQLTKFRESLVKAEEGIRQAVVNYVHTDETIARELA